MRYVLALLLLLASYAHADTPATTTAPAAPPQVVGQVRAVYIPVVLEKIAVKPGVGSTTWTGLYAYWFTNTTATPQTVYIQGDGTYMPVLIFPHDHETMGGDAGAPPKLSRKGGIRYWVPPGVTGYLLCGAAGGK